MEEFYELIKKITAGILILSVVLLVFFAILAIWEVLEKDILFKAVASMAIMSVSSAMLIFTAKIGLRENSLGGMKVSSSSMVMFVAILFFFLYLISLFS